MTNQAAYEVISERELAMQGVANHVQAMVRDAVGKDNIVITYEKMTAGRICGFSTMDRARYLPVTGDEYFFITQGFHTLYVVNVSADSILTAAAELITLAAKKF